MSLEAITVKTWGYDCSFVFQLAVGTSTHRELCDALHNLERDAHFKSKEYVHSGHLNKIGSITLNEAEEFYNVTC